MSTSASVTVVIPTTGRGTLWRAIDSVRAQRAGEPHVVVVWDGPNEDVELSRLREASSDCGFDVVTTGGGQGGSVARDLGVSVATSDLVAFLDDDDFWAPDKLEEQLPHVAPGRVLASRVVPVDAASGRHGAPIPDDVYVGEGRLEDWLFLDRRLSAGRRMIQTSTLLLHRDLATKIGWSSGHRRHDDWGFLLRAEKLGGVAVFQRPEASTFMSVGSASSVTGRGSWRDSLRWMEDHSDGWSDRTISDFIWGQPVRYALQSRQVADAFDLARRATRCSRPSARCVVLGLSGLLGRRVFNAALFEHGRSRGHDDRRGERSESLAPS